MFRASVCFCCCIVFRIAHVLYITSRIRFVCFVCTGPARISSAVSPSLLLLPYPGTRSVGNVLQYTTSWHCIPIFIYLASSFRHGRLDVSPSALLGWVAQMTFDGKLVKHRCANQCPPHLFVCVRACSTDVLIVLRPMAQRSPTFHLRFRLSKASPQEHRSTRSHREASQLSPRTPPKEGRARCIEALSAMSGGCRLRL